MNSKIQHFEFLEVVEVIQLQNIRTLYIYHNILKFEYENKLVVLTDFEKLYKTSKGLETKMRMIVVGQKSKGEKINLTEIENKISNILLKESTQGENIEVLKISSAIANIIKMKKHKYKVLFDLRD